MLSQESCSSNNPTKPRFPIRGINTVESLARHTPDQISQLIQHMARWRMNTVVVHRAYGYHRHADLIHQLCTQHQIDLKFYIQTSLLFLQNTDPSLFARNPDGSLRTTELVGETRLCVSNPAALKAYRRGAEQFFRSDDVPANSSFILTDADGYLFCQCDKCARMKPYDQWMVIFEIAVDQAAQADKGISIEYLSYVWRYAIPTHAELFDRVDGIMFDTHQRFRWKPLNESHLESPYSATEAQVDPRANDVPLNVYLYDRLAEWRRRFPGKLYVFENLMIQGSISAPQPYTPQLLQDLDTYEALGIDGIIYEAFEPGIESFSRQMDVLSRALWDRPLDYTPTPLEQLCLQAQGAGAVDYDFKNQFNVLSYVTLDDYDLPSVLRQSGYDDLLIEYLIRLRRFLKAKSFANYRNVIAFVTTHRVRFDWLMIAFNLARAIPPEHRPWPDDPKIQTFLTVDKLWDIMEPMPDAITQIQTLVETMTNDRFK